MSENPADSATFDALGLSSNVLKAVVDAGYQKPTPIQAQAIPFVLMGRDILGSAQTGTGKTASFTLPMIDILAQGRARARMPRSLILTPTRELAAQIAENFQIYGKYNKLTMALLIGGESFGPQIEKLDRGVDVLIATPGRLIDHFERGRILLTDVKILVIDEADRMLDMGFIPDVERIVGFLPRIRQTLFFSATFPPEVKRLADKFLMNPKEITVSRMSSAAETVEHSFFRCSGRDAEKRAAFRALLGSEDVKNALVFCNRKRDVDVLAKSLRRHGFSVAPLHGDMAQSARTETLEAFKAGKITYLVATDVAGRGLDIQGMSHVFNFDVPFHAEDYVHRIGRTGRAGAKGRAITLATPDDAKFIAAIERLLGKTIPITTIEGFVSPQATGDDGARPDRSRGRSRKSREPSGRGERSRNDRPAAPAEPAADENAGVAQPREPVAAREHDDSDQKSRRSGGRDSRSRGKPRRERQDDSREEDKVVAFGDHMPAFLSREVRIRND
ncbi:MAG: DEAD/DEAH box helicase [Alphaproteobacteria bacterium]|nr:DEAD/DEAH box helicase [Alphaproteobacteria bacterium]